MKSTLIVPDTNYLVDRLSFLEELASQCPRFIIVFIPFIVIRELDALKNNVGPIGVAARKASRFIEMSLIQNPQVVGQQEEQTVGLAGNNDDKIIGCCRYILANQHHCLLLTQGFSG